MEVSIHESDLAPGAFFFELKYLGRSIEFGFWEDGEIIVEEIDSAHVIITPSAESWKRLRLVAGRAAKAVEESES